MIRRVIITINDHNAPEDKVYTINGKQYTKAEVEAVGDFWQNMRLRDDIEEALPVAAQYPIYDRYVSWTRDRVLTDATEREKLIQHLLSLADEWTDRQDEAVREEQAHIEDLVSDAVHDYAYKLTPDVDPTKEQQTIAGLTLTDEQVAQLREHFYNEHNKEFMRRMIDVLQVHAGLIGDDSTNAYITAHRDELISTFAPDMMRYFDASTDLGPDGALSNSLDQLWDDLPHSKIEEEFGLSE